MFHRSVTSCYVFTLVSLVLEIGIVTPQLDSGKYRMDFPEEQEPGTVVARLAELFNVRSDDLPGRSFEILGQRLKAGNKILSADGKWLQIDKLTGVITVREPVDRETECGDDSELECVIMLQATMMPQPHFRLQDFELVVTDVNDHAPKFPATGSNTIFSLNVTEDIPVTTKISLDKFLATDEDIDENAVIYYSISRNDRFGLHQFKDDTGASHLDLVILSKLDFEETSSFDLTLTAKDRGSPTPRSSRVFLRINVLDANDNAPAFDESIYNLELRENLPTGHTITTVVARDADTGLFGQVRYFIPIAGNSVTARKLITVDPKSGAVKLLAPLDRETKKNLRVVIAAADLASVGKKTGKTVLMIHIMDVNDNAPRIHVNIILKGPNKAAYVPEDVTLGTFIAHVSANDADIGDSGKVTLSAVTDVDDLSSGSLASVNSRGRSEGLAEDYFILKGNLIATNAKLDREKEDKYLIKITACDHGNPPRCSQKNISVVVLDCNDHRPRFRTRQHSFILSEDTQIGSYITSVSAYDEDSRNTPAITKTKDGEFSNSRNGEVRYSLIGGGAVFAVESKTGKLTLVGKLDYEMKHVWKLTIVAQDLGETPQKANFTLTVTVVDVNDHKPEFTNPAVANMTVYATILDQRGAITRIKTIDRDAGNNAKVWYSISSEDGARKSKKFLLDPVTGILRFNTSNKIATLLGEHALTIKATDKGTPQLESETSIIVKVTDLPLSSINTNDEEEGDAESSSTTIIVLATLASATLVLFLILACIVMKCRKENKMIRTYNIPSAESKPGRHIASQSKSTMSHVGSVDEVVVVTTPGLTTTKDIHFGRAMEINRSRSMTLRSGKQNSASATITMPRFATIDKGPSFTTFSQKNVSNVPANNQMTLSHTDGDSGRGDSDKDSDSYGGEKEPQGSLAPSESNYSQYCSGYLNELGPRCTIGCRKYGHSDECWMPVVAHCEIHGEHDSFVYSDGGNDLNDSVRGNRNCPENVMPSTNSLPGRYGNFDNCGLETISETQPLHIVLDTVDQTSMYSCESYNHQDYPTYPPHLPYSSNQYHRESQAIYSPPPYYSQQPMQNLPVVQDQADWRDAYRPQQMNDPPRYSTGLTEPAGRSPSAQTSSRTPYANMHRANGSASSALSSPYVPVDIPDKYRNLPIRPQSVCEASTSATEVLSTGSVMEKVKRFSQGPVRRGSLRDHVLQSRFLSTSLTEDGSDSRLEESLLQANDNHISAESEDADANASLEETKRIISDIDNLISS